MKKVRDVRRQTADAEVSLGLRKRRSPRANWLVGVRRWRALAALGGDDETTMYAAGPDSGSCTLDEQLDMHNSILSQVAASIRPREELLAALLRRWHAGGPVRFDPSMEPAAGEPETDAPHLGPGAGADAESAGRLRRRRKRRLIHQTSERTRRRHLRARNATHEASSKLRRHPSRRGVFARRRPRRARRRRRASRRRIRGGDGEDSRRRHRRETPPARRVRGHPEGGVRGEARTGTSCSTFGWTSPRRRRRGGRRNGAFAWRGVSRRHARRRTRARFSFPSRTPRRRRFERADGGTRDGDERSAGSVPRGWGDACPGADGGRVERSPTRAGRRARTIGNAPPRSFAPRWDASRLTESGSCASTRRR